MNAVILSATFSMEKSTVENVYVRIQDRLMHVKENQEGKLKKKEVDNSKEELKQIIKEVLVELIVK